MTTATMDAVDRMEAAKTATDLAEFCRGKHDERVQEAARARVNFDHLFTRRPAPGMYGLEEINHYEAAANFWGSAATVIGRGGSEPIGLVVMKHLAETFHASKAAPDVNGSIGRAVTEVHRRAVMMAAEELLNEAAWLIYGDDGNGDRPAAY